MRRAALATRLDRLEAAAHAALRRRFQDAYAAQRATMAPEHVAIFDAWHTPEVRADLLDHPGEPWPVRMARLKPPSLVRAMYELVGWHLDTGAPLDLSPEVARVYLDDPDTWARDDCAACGYLAPVRCRTARDGRLEPLHHYFPRCPRCGGATGGYAYLRGGDPRPGRQEAPR